MKITNNTITQKSLKKNFSFVFFSNLFFSLSQWGVLISIARFGDVEMVGQYTLGLAIISPMLMLTNLKIETIYITDKDNVYKFADYFTLRIITSIFTLILLVSSLAFMSNNSETLIVITLVGIYKIIEAISEILYASMQKEEHVSAIAISKIIKGSLTLLITTVVLYLTSNLIISLFFIIIIYFTTLLTFDLPKSLKFQEVYFKIITTNLRQIAILSLPLGIVYLLISLNTNLPRYFVEHYFSVETLGYFAAISYVVTNNINIFTNALNKIIIPRFSNLLYENKTEQARKLLKKLDLLGGGLGAIGFLGVYLFGEEILSVIYGKEYSDYSDLFSILMLSSPFIFISTFHSCYIYAAKFFKIQPFLGVIWIISTFLAGLLIIPEWGIIGVGYTVVFGSIVQLISRYILMKYIMKKQQNI